MIIMNKGINTHNNYKYVLIKDNKMFLNPSE